MSVVQLEMTTCDACAFWRHISGSAGTCRRNAPAAGDGPAEVAHWPETEASAFCGEAVAAAATAIRLTLCRDCQFWLESRNGQGLQPVDRRDQLKGWWMQAGYCVRHAPQPASEPGRQGFWRATHASDGCAEGRVATTPQPGDHTAKV